MTLNINNLVDTLYNEQNIARENIGIIDLDLANGIPDFSKFSLRKGEEGNGP
jgi:hypothetical protein